MYLLFAGTEDDTLGGADDLLGHSDDINECFKALDLYSSLYTWAHIYDIDEQSIILFWNSVDKEWVK